MKEFDVTIVGLGPAGGTLANLLAMHGFSILILDREKSFYPLPRAVHFDDEIMRVFQTIGITKDFLKHTIINKGTKFVNSKDKVILDWPRPKKITDNGWYPSYRFHQPDLEKKLRKKLKNYKKVSIEQNSEVKKIINSKNQVDIIYANISSHKEYIVRSKYLVGCDGANSITRKQMKTTMDNLGFTQKWAVVDLILKKKKNNLPDRTIQYSNPKQPATYCRNVGKRRRWEFAIKKNHSDKKVLSERYIWNFLKPWLKKSEAIIERKTIYTFESAIARKWRKGRVFIAGDAAHLMPPFMGQGMCAGIRDASNLAWKIANCLRNKFNETLLNTYQSERSLNVKEYIETTMRMGEFVNAVESIQITDNIRSDNKGIKSMQSIKPKLGKGLGNLKDKNRGKTFPQFKLKNNKTLDNNFSKKGMIVLSSDVNPKTSKYYSILKAKNFSNVSRYLKNIKSTAILVRPDRFILASARSNKEVNLLLKKYSSILR
ncbi:bifunctional 3-(3-hydroxy-phenyl)propionate/3-hydroxycinnamic acid hydroxylase [Candidatus Pelagibacter sp.]|nr:bifunctional 3-(3-hydroxy-phenyl)propionate/3-hydroxycinnamic acid hydroxylase [Candidatus Pelagibacter sp.]